MAVEWEQQPGETVAAYRAFCSFRDMGADRTALAAYKQAWCKPLAKQLPGTWTAWGVKHRWQARVAAYDAHLEREARLKAEKDTIARRAAMIRRHQQAGELLTSRGVEFFAKQKVEDGRTAISAIGKGIEVERQAEGLPTWLIEMYNAPQEVLDERIAELERRRRTAAEAVPDSAGDTVSVLARNGHAKL